MRPQVSKALQTLGEGVGEAVLFACEDMRFHEQDQIDCVLIPFQPMYVTTQPQNATALLKLVGRELPEGEEAPQTVEMEAEPNYMLMMNAKVLKGIRSKEPGQPATFICW